MIYACKQIVISRVVEDSGGKFVLGGQVQLSIMKGGREMGNFIDKTEISDVELIMSHV